MSRLCMLLLFTSGLTVHSPAVSVAQDDPSELFNLANTDLDRNALKRFAVDLVDYAQGRCKTAPDYHVIGDYRKLIRVAYQLASEEQGVVSAYAKIKKGLAPEAPKKEVAAAALMPNLLALAKLAKQGTSPDQQKVARYLYAVGLMVDPQNDVCLIQAEMLQKQAGELPWEKVLAGYRRNVPDGHTSAINGLVVMTVNTTQAGQVSKILLTYRNGPQPLTVKFLREGGGMMVVSMEEAIRYWDRLRKSMPMPTGTIEISFEDKFSKKDGPSAGAAYTVLMRSFSDPFQIDTAFAMTGDISVEGKILKIGGAYAKTRGALQAKCSRVGLPHSNEGELTDAIVLNGPATLAEIEVYGMESIEDAVALARTDKDARIEATSTLFAKLQPLLQKRMQPKQEKSAEIEQITAEILKNAPRHFSAKLIAAFNDGTLPQTLTLGSSLDEPTNIFFKYLATISPKGTPSFAAIAQETNSSTINGTLKALRDLKPKLHADAKKPSEKLESVCSTIMRHIAARPDIEEKEKRIDLYSKKIDDYKFKIEKAKAEKQPVETINKLVKQHNDAVEDHKNAGDRYTKAVAERNDVLAKVIQTYNEYSAMIRELTQDPHVLEKLVHGK